jgi:hypothetical protein
LDQRLVVDVAGMQQAAKDDVRHLVDELEQTLDGRERRLLHRLRLAAETLGAVRVRRVFPARRR